MKVLEVSLVGKDDELVDIQQRHREFKSRYDNEQAEFKQTSDSMQEQIKFLKKAVEKEKEKS